MKKEWIEYEKRSQLEGKKKWVEEQKLKSKWDKRIKEWDKRKKKEIKKIFFNYKRVFIEVTSITEIDIEKEMEFGIEYKLTL